MEEGARFARRPPAADGGKWHDRTKRMRPYVIGAAAGAASAIGIEIILAGTLRDDRDLFIVGAGVAYKLGKEIRDARRSSRMEDSGKIARSRLLKSEQMEIAKSGSFQQKVALLRNRRLKAEALSLLRESPDLGVQLSRNLEKARHELLRLEKEVYKYPNNTFYEEMIRETRREANEYIHALNVLNGDRGIGMREGERRETAVTRA